MADSLMSYAIVAGIFAFLAAVLFSTRAKRFHSGWVPDTTSAGESDRRDTMAT